MEGGVLMELLFKRAQSSSRLLKVSFKLWGKIDLDEEEQALVKRYSLGDACLIEDFQPKLIRNATLFGLFVGLVLYTLTAFMPDSVQNVLAILAIAGGGFWFYHQKRETIFVKDLLHGRHFSCRSIVDLAHKEAWLEERVAILRQVLESAKHWDGTETIAINALPKDEAKALMLAAA